MKENFNKQTTEIIDTTDAINPTPTVTVGHIYPNLHSQEYYLNKDVENIKNEIVGVVDDINTYGGAGTVKLIIDSIYHFIDNQISSSKDFDDYFNEKNLQELSYDVYARVELAKHMLDLINLSNRLKDKKDNIELTKRNILL